MDYGYVRGPWVVCLKAQRCQMKRPGHFLPATGPPLPSQHTQTHTHGSHTGVEWWKPLEITTLTSDQWHLLVFPCPYSHVFWMLPNYAAQNCSYGLAGTFICLLSVSYAGKKNYASVINLFILGLCLWSNREQIERGAVSDRWSIPRVGTCQETPNKIEHVTRGVLLPANCGFDPK